VESLSRRASALRRSFSSTAGLRTLWAICLVVVAAACAGRNGAGGPIGTSLVADSSAPMKADPGNRCAPPDHTEDIKKYDLAAEDLAGTGISVRVGDVLELTSRVPDGATRVVAVTQPWTPRPDTGGGGVAPTHSVLCRFSADEGPSRTTHAKFIAVAEGRTYVASTWIFDRTPEPETPSPEKSCGTKENPCVGRPSTSGGIYRVSVSVND
jgi:hypothetical protein